MRIESMEGDAFVSLSEWEIDAHGGDVQATVEAQDGPFSGKYFAWFFREDVLAFVAALDQLAQTHEGAARLESMSPGEVVLHAHRLDLARHLVLHVAISASRFVRDRRCVNQVSISFEVAPPELAQAASALTAVLASG